MERVRALCIVWILLPTKRSIFLQTWKFFSPEVLEIERKELFWSLEFSDGKSDFSQASFSWLQPQFEIKTGCLVAEKFLPSVPQSYWKRQRASVNRGKSGKQQEGNNHLCASCVVLPQGITANSGLLSFSCVAGVSWGVYMCTENRKINYSWNTRLLQIPLSSLSKRSDEIEALFVLWYYTYSISLINSRSS